MYNQAIEKLETEIKEREDLIKNIKNFDILSLSDKLETIKYCSLRYERDTIPKIIQKDFKSKILRNSEDVHIGVNNFIIKHDGFIFSIGLYSGKIVEVESEEKVRSYNDETPININETYLQDIKEIKEFLNKQSFKKYKKVLPKLYREFSSINYIMYFLRNKLIQKKANIQLKELERYVSSQEIRIKEQEESLNRNEELKLKQEKFLKDIEVDLKYFESNDYRVIFKFNHQLF